MFTGLIEVIGFVSEIEMRGEVTGIAFSSPWGLTEIKTGDSIAVNGACLTVVGLTEKTFTVDVRGFLVHPQEWDEEFAVHRAAELKMAPLNDRHWQVIWFLRRRFHDDGSIPTVYETCEQLGLGLGELEELFPDGYHGGAVKIAGLRAAGRRNTGPAASAPSGGGAG